MKAVVVFMLAYHVAQARVVEDSNKYTNDGAKEVITLEKLLCNVECSNKCKSNLKNDDCEQKCCDSEKFENLSLDAENNQKVRWWVNTQASKTKNFSTCQNDCDKFCYSLKGDIEVCKGKCSEKFCAENSNFFNFVIVGTLMVILVFIVVKNLLGKRIQINDEFSYKKV